MMTDDPEIAAMASIKEALAGLDDEAARRALRWAAERYGVVLATGGATARAPRTGVPQAVGSADLAYGDMAEFYDAANPETEPEKALVVGYWFQKIKAQSDVDGQQINKELKHLGHGVANITRALTNLMNRKPRLVIQTHKSGKTKQARKRYKLTVEGLRAVDQMLAREEPEG